MDDERIISPEIEDAIEERMENSLRPKLLEEYVGQDKVKENLKVYIEAAKKRGEPLDHVLLYGPPGLGKTTLANIISNEMNSNIKITSGPAIEKPGDLAALLTNLSEFDVLFIDEIHRLNKSVEEILYPALEDYTLDIMIGKGPSARSIRLDLPKFTLIGATTRAGSLATPLRDRFGIVNRLELYNTKDLTTIVKRSAGILEVNIDEDSAIEIAKRSRGTPRIANRLLKRVRDYAAVLGNGDITSPEKAKEAFERYGVDGVMIGRATIGHPWIFKQIRHYFETGELLPDLSVKEQIEVIKEQILLSVEWIDEVRGLLHMRRHMASMFKGLPHFRDLRIRMLQAPTIDVLWEVFDEIEKRYSDDYNLIISD